jgi:hypothetical protein
MAKRRTVVGITFPSRKEGSRHQDARPEERDIQGSEKLETKPEDRPNSGPEHRR